MSKPLAGKRLVGKAGDDVKVGVRDLLAGHGAGVPPDGEPIGTELPVRPLFETPQEPESGRPLLRSEVKDRFTVRLWNDNGGALENVLVAYETDAEVIPEEGTADIGSTAAERTVRFQSG